MKLCEEYSIAPNMHTKQFTYGACGVNKT